MASPLVDVIVVNFNSGYYLRRCLASLYRSDSPLSVIVVDNASGDKSIDFARELDCNHHQVEFVLNTENVGFSAAVNCGAKYAADHTKGDFLFLLNPDCEVHAHTVSKLVKILASAPNAAIVGALVFNEDGTEQRGCRRREPTLARSVVTALRQDHRRDGVNLLHQSMPTEPVEVDAVSGAALMIKREDYDAVDGMDEGYFLHVEDLDVCRKVRNLGKRVLFASTVSIFHHQGVASRRVPVRTEWHKHRGMLRYHDKFQRSQCSMLSSWAYKAIVLSNLLVTLMRKSIGLLRHVAYEDQVPLELVHLSESQLTVLTGATSDLGSAILQTKIAGPLVAVTRSAIPEKRVSDEIWLNWRFFEKVPEADFGQVKHVMMASPIWGAESLARTLNRFGGIERLVAFSSTSIEGKAETTDVSERKVLASLAEGETSLLTWSQQESVSSTILRATMIYGGQQNENVGFIAKVLRYCRVFPLVDDGIAMRQPVHVDDLANACNRVIQQTSSDQTTYNLAGGEQLSYRQMVERIYDSLEIEPRFFVLEQTRLRKLIRSINWVPGLRFLKAEMVTRLTRNLVYDNSAAKTDFNYQPGPFRP